ncbi:MAG: arginine--tRNA ligase [Nanoarchaeota archaeon]|nr:arginine--tRNA ligase [Nanoarchaeota archaeon]
MDFRKDILKLVEKEVKIDESLIEVPPDSKLGDYAIPCFTLAKQLKKNPQQIAAELAAKIKPNDTVTKIAATGPYINFFINKSLLAEDTVNTILKQKDKYGHSSTGKGKTVLVEYPGPNTNKPLHIGHLRNMALGETLSNLMESQGYKVGRVNVINDRGVHICKSMLAYDRWGEDKTPESEGKKSDHFVGDYYVLFAKKAKDDPKLEEETQELLRKWEANDPKTRKLWEKMNKWALSGFEETYKRFGLPRFDKEYFESNTYLKGKDVVLEGLKKGIFKKKDDGAIIIDLSKEGLGEKVLLRADGTTVYMTQDIYLAEARYADFKYDKMIYVVATEQNHHFRTLFIVLKKLGHKFADGCHHFAYGMVLLPEGKMKSREGTVVDADDLMLELEDLAKDEIIKRYKDLEEQEIHDRARMIGLGALKFYLLMTDAVKDITFHPEQSLSFEGDTGPYLQYTHARACSIMKKAEEQGVKIDTKKKLDFSVLKMPEEIALIQSLSEFPSKTKDACDLYKPHLVAQYLLSLGRAFNEFYHACPCLQEKDENLSRARLVLVNCTRQVLHNGLSLLGMTAPEEM